MSDPQASALLVRLERIDVPPDLLRDVLHAHARAKRGSATALSDLIRGRLGDGAPAGRQAEVALAAKLRILSLACLVRDHVVDDWIKPEDGNGIVLFHRSLFLAAAAEPLLQLPNGDIGFDPARFRRRVLALTAVQGSA